MVYHLPMRLLPALCLCVSLPWRLCSGLLLLWSEELLVRERLRLLLRPGERERDLNESKVIFRRYFVNSFHSVLHSYTTSESQAFESAKVIIAITI